MTLTKVSIIHRNRMFAQEISERDQVATDEVIEEQALGRTILGLLLAIRDVHLSPLHIEGFLLGRLNDSNSIVKILESDMREWRVMRHFPLYRRKNVNPSSEH
jgi:hypothetical protein